LCSYLTGVNNEPNMRKVVEGPKTVSPSQFKVQLRPILNAITLLRASNRIGGSTSPRPTPTYRRGMKVASAPSLSISVLLDGIAASRAAPRLHRYSVAANSLRR